MRTQCAQYRALGENTRLLDAGEENAWLRFVNETMPEPGANHGWSLLSSACEENCLEALGVPPRGRCQRGIS